jgi:pyrimidine-nucleoside phosphorylase
MIPSRVIEAKRDGRSIDPEELQAFLTAFLDDRVHDYQMAAFLMAAYFQGLDALEMDTLVRCMLGSGSTLDLSHLGGRRIVKNSTGGVGDKVSLALAPLAAACGLYVPMMSGRGLGHTAGTLDKLEAIPGFRTQLTLDQFRSTLETVGCAMIGQTSEIAPLDRRLYALRDVTATVPVIPLIAASIMSKKLAEGLTGLVLDVKVGSGAFIPEEARALELARAMVSVGAARDLPTVAMLTAMDRPLGRAVGNGLETAEAIECLRGGGPPDLAALVVDEVAEMLVLAQPGLSAGEARRKAAAERSSGGGLARLVAMIEAQGGDPSVVDRPERLKTSRYQRIVAATGSGTVIAVRPRPLGQGVVLLGGGRRRMDETIDLGVGFELAVSPGDEVRSGDPLGTVHARDAAGLEEGASILSGAVEIGAGVPELRPLVSHRVTAAGVFPTA